MGRAIFYSLFGIVFLWIGSNLTPYAYGLYVKGQASETWVPVEARVTSFKAHRSRNMRSGPRKTGGRSANTIKVAFHYQYGGIEYDGDRTGFGPYSFKQLDQPNRKGKATVFVNPQTPSESVYAKGVSKKI